MKNILNAARQVLADLSALEIPTIATAIAGQLAPIVALIAGAGITAAEIVPYELAIGMLAATLQKLLGPANTTKPAGK